ncbi:hypothetical protein TNIN_249421 [Trichonephila inaurata madagascariensis]|uniref:Uncharacterized protein n=1 Tax=Trichonephila inaurata madagascariensis TaxID=2747483 RepID=A0A8X6XG24_9ARAC|nr:hypothetical protein TNIN_249421 [Trichonephila inaurata madagascariensis]
MSHAHPRPRPKPQCAGKSTKVRAKVLKANIFDEQSKVENDTFLLCVVPLAKLGGPMSLKDGAVGGREARPTFPDVRVRLKMGYFGK